MAPRSTRAALAALIALAAATPAEASFPGRNGLVAYASPGPKPAQIHTMTAAGRERRRLTSGGASRNPAWSPDGRSIAFDRLGAGGSRRKLFVMRADGSGERAVPTGRVHGYNPSWSADGRHLVFQGCRGSHPCEEETIFVVRRRGGGLKRLAEGIQPVWSPNGRWIAYRGAIAAGECDTLILIRPSGRSRHAILPRGRDSNGVCAWGGFGADFSPDSRRLVYYGLRPTGDEHIYNPTMYTVRADGSGRRVIASRPLEATGYFVPPFAWSPDGERLLWRDDRGTFLAGPTGDGRRRVRGPDGLEYAWQALPRK